MGNYIDLVSDFHKAFDHPINKVKDVIPLKVS